MPPRRNKLDEFFRDPRRGRIHRRLLLIGEGPAAFYRDACRILDSGEGLRADALAGTAEAAGDAEPNPLRLVSEAHLVGHLFREIESAIT